MTYEYLRYDLDDGIATVTLNQPETLNALSPELRDELLQVFEETALDDEVLVTILTGEGRGFCAGAFVKDPQTHALDSVPNAVMQSPEPNAFPWDYPKPLIAAVNGHAYGAGLNIVLCCDIVLASTAARFCFPMARLGIIPAWPGVATLAQFVGKAKAAEMALMARPIDGEEAYRVGLANACVDPDDLMDTAWEWAQELRGLAPVSLRLIKDELRDTYEPLFDRKRNRLRFQAAQVTEDRVEGHAAWREKRAPRFRGR